jgi:hypothetical protein
MSAPEYEEWRDANTWDPSRETELVIETDLAPAAWLQPLLDPDLDLPTGFDAYAQIFFPFAAEDVAERRERIADALAEPEAIILAGPDGQADPEARCAFLPLGQFNELLPILARHTSSAVSWFLLWDGFGDLNERAFSQAPKVNYPVRDLYLLRGPHSAYLDFPSEPNYWWPDDRAWCVCSDTDWTWAYIAGSNACISEILRACDR